MKKKKPTAELPAVSKDEVAKLPKTEALLLRLTADDKRMIFQAASSLHLTATEFVTKSALLVASKLDP